jgi:hypothetical protein
MQKFLNVKNIVALVLICIGLGIQLRPFIPDLSPKPNVAILDIDKPNDKVLELVQPVSDLVTDPTDRAKMAIYSQEFANRINKYDIQLQQVNDILSLSAKEFFQDTIKDKYVGFDDAIVNLIMQSAGGDENHKLTDSEKGELSSVFMGLAWSLIQRK